MINTQNVQHSLIEHLRTKILDVTEVIWHYDGLAMDGKVKPFLLVENMQEEVEVIAAGRGAHEEVYRFQVGIFANSQSQLNHMAQKTKEVIRDLITLYDASQQPPQAVGFFHADPGQIVPIRSEDLADEMNRHRSYIDVTATFIVQGGTFQQ